jgi:hypothetical protein
MSVSVSDLRPWAQAYYAQQTVEALRLFAEAPRSAPKLAEHLQVSVSAARRLIQRLAADGLLEGHPDSRYQYRIAAGGYDLGLLLVRSGLRELERRGEPLTVGQALGRYRRARGLSGLVFGEMLGTSRVYEIENGRHRVDGHELLAFASRLGVDALDLLMLRRT